MSIRLGALSNAFTADQKMSFINSGKDEVWAVLRSLDLDYFTDSSQDTDSTQDDYLIDLTPTVREYTLPKNEREVRMIECLSSGFENRVFEFRPINDPVFQQARRDSTANGPSGTSGTFFTKYYFTIFGNQLMLAAYPEAALKLKLWYVAAIDDVAIDSFPNILFPFSRKIVDYAVQLAMLTAQNTEMAVGWLTLWKEDIKVLAITSGPRSSTNAIYVTDYLGE